MKLNYKVIRVRFQNEIKLNRRDELVDTVMKEVLGRTYDKFYSKEKLIKVRLILSQTNDLTCTLDEAIEIMDWLARAGLEVSMDIYRMDESSEAHEANLEAVRSQQEEARNRIYLSGWTQEDLTEMVDYTRFYRFLEPTVFKSVYGYDYEGRKLPTWKQCGCEG